MEVDKRKKSYSVKGGRTILGKIFSYQEKTGMPIKEILKIPYIQFVIGMLDAPSIDYDKEEENEEEKIIRPKTAQEEMNALAGALM